VQYSHGECAQFLFCFAKGPLQRGSKCQPTSNLHRSGRRSRQLSERARVDGGYRITEIGVVQRIKSIEPKLKLKAI
jgi:hypothetical protein